MEKLKIFLLLSILLCFGFALSSEVHAQGDGPKIFEVGDVLPATVRLRISWTNNILNIPKGRYIWSYSDNFIIVGKRSTDSNIYIRDSDMETEIVIYNGSNFIPPYTNYDGNHAYIEIDTTTWDINRRTISKVDTGMNKFTWEDLNAPSGYTITFNSNGGSTIPDEEEATVLPTPLPTPTKENHTFLGWYYNSAFTQIATAGDTIESDVTLYAKWELNAYKAFEVGDVLPATPRLRISWIDDILDIPHARYILAPAGPYAIVSIFDDIISIRNSNMDGQIVIYNGSNFIPPYTNYDGNHPYIEIDTTTWDIYERTISRVDNGMDIFTWEDMYANFEEGYLEARERYGYYDPITEQWLSVEEYLELYGTDKMSQTDFYNNFDKYFIPAMIIVFGGAIVLTVLKVFKGRE